MWSGAALVAAVALSAVSCGGDGRPSAVEPEVLGPARVRIDVVVRHARQLDDEIGRRLAGSQQEVAAATYILGHLQQAGYVARLDAVPVADLVRSTNVIAIPPNAAKPTVVVTVPYDSSADGPVDGGAQVGLFLELARALRRLNDGHSVEFVALGAERERGLGSLALVRLLEESGEKPAIVSLESGSGRVVATGDRASEIYAAAGIDRPPTGAAPQDHGYPFEGAGFEHTVVTGDPRRVAAALIVFLRGDHR